MPPPDLTVVKNRGTGNIEVYPMTGGTTLGSQDGTGFSDTFDTPNENQTRLNNLGVEFRGKRYIWVGNNVRERDQGGSGNWGNVYTVSPSPEEEFYSGLYVATVQGVPVLCGMYGGIDAATRRARVIYSYDGTSWTNTIMSDDINTWGRSGVGITIGSKMLWILGWDFGGIRAFHLYDFESLTYRGWDTETPDFPFSFGIAELPGADLLEHKGTLFLTVPDSLNQLVYRLDGHKWVTVVTSGDDNSSPYGTCLIDDGDDIILISSALSTQSWKAYRIQNPMNGSGRGGTAPSISDISGTVVPALSNTTYNFWKYCDVVTTPGTRQWYFWQSTPNSGSGNYTCYQWNGISSAITSVGASIAANLYTLPHSSNGGAERIPTTEALPDFDGLPLQLSSSQRRRFFRLYRSVADVNLRQYHGTDSAAPDTLSTLVASTIELADAIDVTGLVGNLGEVALEALSPASGDAYVVSATDGDSTLNPGSLSIAVGDIVQYDGANWTQSVANSGGFPPAMTHANLNSTTALIAPYTDGSDDGKDVSFDGASLNGTVLSTPTNTTTQINGITPDDGMSLWQYTHDVSADSLSVGQRYTIMLDTV